MSAPSSPPPAAGDSSADERAKSLVGRVIGERYRVDSVIAIGGMGAVYRGEHLHMRKEVAVKVLHPQTEGFPELVARFEREAVAGAHITHPNVATAHDFGTFDGECRFLVMESIRGTTLRDIIDAGPSSVARATSIVKQLAAALGAAHEKGIVHRDLKPRNVMVTDAKQQVKLIDFGFARVPEDGLFPSARDEDTGRRSITQAGAVFGTIAYMAPETALGMRSVDARSDLYAVGLLFYELLAGKHPFDGADPLKQFAQTRSEEPPPIAERNPDVSVPENVEAIIRKLLQKDPADRYQDAADLIVDLEATETPSGKLATVTPLPAPTPEVVVVEAPAPPPSRAKLPIFLILNVLVLGVFGVLIFQHLEHQPAATAPLLLGSEMPLASSSASAAPSASAPTTDLLALRLRLLRAAEGPDTPEGPRALLALADGDPNAFWDHEVKVAASTITSRAATRGGDDADRIFFALSYKLGSDGLDVLYDVIASGKSTRGSGRAKAILSERDVLAKATPAMQIAFQLRRTACQEKPRLFAKAGDEGDERVIVVLESLRDRHCDPTLGHCCFKHDDTLDHALAAIRARLK